MCFWGNFWNLEVIICIYLPTVSLCKCQKQNVGKKLLADSHFTNVVEVDVIIVSVDGNINI